MSVAIITGAAGLIGSEACKFFAKQGFDIVGIDNNMRQFFFGADGSTNWNRQQLEKSLGTKYYHLDVDIRDYEAITNIFQRYGESIELVIHTATLNLLEVTRLYCPNAVFIFTSTNKVYGDTPNKLPLVELEHRWEIEPGHTYEGGIREDMSIDQCLHSLFGASKVSADVLVQEYGRYFNMNTACFRGGCLTGPNHSGAQLHGFLAYLMKCAATGTPYTVFGYKGKQVRDNIHSADLISAFYEFYKAPRSAQVYNTGGGRYSNCSMLEAIQMCEAIAERKFNWTYAEGNRIGDHIWWISDNSKFSSHYPDWKMKYNVKQILQEIYDCNRERWLKQG
ncbi:MAG: NAD-dependent epimerase/dehydratase family protein [Oscillatoriales cyanobacterium]|nr:MAG: NAD-dependent epimerase/dehydratase family protein [Oscillatoriales cyanobacterium]